MDVKNGYIKNSQNGNMDIHLMEPSSKFMFVIAAIAMVQIFFQTLDAIPVLSQIIAFFKLPVLLAFWLCGYIFIYGKTIKIKPWMLIGILWLVLMAAFSIMGDSFSYKRLIFDGSIFFLALIFDFFNQRKEFDQLKKLVNISLFCMAVTIIYTCFELRKYPLLAKIMTTGSYERMKSAIGTIVYGAGGYDFVYGSLCLLPILIMLIKIKSSRKIYIVSFIVLIVIYIFMAQYTIALILMLISLFISLAVHRQLSFKWVALITAAVLLLYYAGMAELILRWLISLFPSDSLVSPRLKIVLNMIAQQNMDSFYRAGTYLWNFQSFAARPFGNVFLNCFTTQPILFHDPNHIVDPSDSEWLYLFSYYGIFVAPIFIAYLVAFLHDVFKIRKMYNPKLLSGAEISYGMIFIIGFLNTLFLSTAFGCIVFLIIPSILTTNQKNIEINLISNREDSNENLVAL